MRTLAALLALAAIGCNKPELAASEKPKNAPVEGVWIGTFQPGEKDQAKLSEEERKQAKEFYAAMKLTLDLHADGTYTMNGQELGKWTMKDGDVVITDDKAMADDPYKNQTFEMQDGGDTMVGQDPTGESDSRVVFTRSEAKEAEDKKS